MNALSAMLPRGLVPAGGPVADCVSCDRWAPGSTVYRGNTQGWCQQHARSTGADWTCDEHSTKAKPK